MSNLSTITVLVLYTPEAAQRLGNDPRTPIQQVIDVQNGIFANSGVAAQVVLGRAELLSEFEEQRELGADRATATVLRILERSLGDDKFGIKRRRDESRADIVSVWVELEGLNTIGSASRLLSNTRFQQGSIIAAEEAFLNVIITAKAGAPLYHFAHELGHNMGLGHDIGASDPTGDLVFGYARGYVDITVPFRTVMAYNTACQLAGFDDCPRIPFYSSASPHIQFNGRPVGHPTLADEARALATTIPFVATYRRQLPGLNFEPPVVNFGSVTVGQVATRTLTMKNGLGGPVNFSVQASPAGSVFQWAAASGTLANDAETTFTLRFRPVSNAIERTTLRVTSTAPGSPHSIGLLGKGPGGIPPNGDPEKTLDFHPEPVNFGSVGIGTVATRTLTVENHTGRTVNLSFPAGSGLFSWSAFSGSLAHGTSRGFELRFRPASNAIARGQLLVTSDAPGSPHRIGLIGKGPGGF